MLEQEEFASLYTLQAETLQGTEEVVAVVEEGELEPETAVAFEDEPISEKVIQEEEPIIETPIVVEEALNENEKKSSSEELTEQNLTANNLNADEDAFSNLKYNKQFNYTSPQANAALEVVSEMKNEARKLKEEGEVKMNAAGKATEEEGKKRLIKEADVLNEKSERKQESTAKVYEGANRNEYYNNQKQLTELLKDNTINPININ